MFPDTLFFIYSFLKGFEGKTPGLAGVVTLASSLDYTSSNSSLKLLLPIVSGKKKKPYELLFANLVFEKLIIINCYVG